MAMSSNGRHITNSGGNNRRSWCHADRNYYRGTVHATLVWLCVWILAYSLMENDTYAPLQDCLQQATTSNPTTTTTSLFRNVLPDDSMAGSLGVPSNKASTTILATESFPNTNVQVVELSQTITTSTSRTIQTIDRQILVNGQPVTSLRSHTQFYESLVHPAFMAASVPIQSVLLMGGASGGALCEILKYKAVQNVTVVLSNPVDSAVQKLTRKYLSAISIGERKECWQDNRVEVVYTNQNSWDWLQREWFEGSSNFCNDRSVLSANGKLFDLILFDKLDQHAMDSANVEDEHDEQKGSYDDESTDSASSDSADSDDYDNEEEELDYWDFARAVSCAVQKFGIVAISIGYAPPPGFATAFLQQQRAFPSKSEIHLHPMVQEYAERLEIIGQVLDYFWHQRVYDIPLLASMGDTGDHQYWTVALGMVPYIDPLAEDIELQQAVFDGRATGGANNFDDRPAKINLELRRQLNKGIRLLHYDGVVQQFFQHSAADWHGIYCLNPAHDRVCRITEAFTTDYEDDILEVQLESNHNVLLSGTRAKVDIPAGTITGLWDAATDINLPAASFYRARSHMAVGFDTQYHDFAAWVDTYGFDGGLSGLGERIQISLASYHNFLNHACNHQPNLVNWGQWAPWWKEQDMARTWNPVAVRIAGEMDHFKVAARDIRKGELILDDYSKWDGFLQSRNGLRDFSRLDLWCNNSAAVATTTSSTSSTTNSGKRGNK